MHMLKKKIYYHDTDSGGVVYYANYLKYIEEARTEYFAERGIDLGSLAKAGTLFVVSRQEVDYKYPGFYADTLAIETGVMFASGARLGFEHSITNQHGRLLVKALTTLVCVDKNLKPQAVPEEIKSKL
jgi:acyl-CoA thioester hydrolase